MSRALDVDALRAQFLNRIFDEISLAPSAQDMAVFARCCGETAAHFTDPAHPEFQAPPTFPASFHPGRRLPSGFPELPGLGMDGGKAVRCRAPIRPGVALTARTHLHEIRTKTGRSGRMVFLVNRMEVFDPQDVLLASVDTSIVIRERPGE